MAELANRYYLLIKSRSKALNVEKIADFVPCSALPFHRKSQINWSQQVMKSTIKSSWHTWKNYHKNFKHELANIAIDKDP